MAFFFNVLLEKLHGNRAGTLIIGDYNFPRILKMDENYKTDYNGTSSPDKIKTTLITKVYSGGAATELVRIRKLKANYKKTDGQDVIHTITNPDTGDSRTVTDSVNSDNESNYKPFSMFTDGMAGDLKVEAKAQYKIQNCEAFDGMVIQARAVKRGSR